MPSQSPGPLRSFIKWPKPYEDVARRYCYLCQSSGRSRPLVVSSCSGQRRPLGTFVVDVASSRTTSARIRPVESAIFARLLLRARFCDDQHRRLPGYAQTRLLRLNISVQKPNEEKKNTYQNVRGAPILTELCVPGDSRPTQFAYNWFVDVRL